MAAPVNAEVLKSPAPDAAAPLFANVFVVRSAVNCKGDKPKLGSIETTMCGFWAHIGNDSVLALRSETSKEAASID
jgi:hypothetical protein